jgi:hypothetical protein
MAAVESPIKLAVQLPALRVSAGRVSSDVGPTMGSGDNDRLHIVFVDDEATLAELGRRRLEAAGFKVTVFISSVRALEDVRSRPEHSDLLDCS